VRRLGICEHLWPRVKRRNYVSCELLRKSEIRNQAMGNVVSGATPRAATAGIDSYVGEIPEVTYEKR
jgi:hypothetical protein